MPQSYVIRREIEMGAVRCFRADGTELTPDRSQKVYNHSPHGFNIGYGGSGPSQLALAIMLDVGIAERSVFFHYHEFKRRFLATTDVAAGGEVEIYSDLIAAFLEQREVRV